MAGIYIHIPFCRQACNYCNFHFSTSLKRKSEMIAAIQKEIRLQGSYLEGQTIETVYFGGGTPSLLTAPELMLLWQALEDTFPSMSPAEITLEANPDNLTAGYLKALRGTPINRLSIGIQSFRDADLRYMNRAHSAAEAAAAVKTAQDAGLSDISIDLIYGTPTMNAEEWRDNIGQALRLKVPHISCYALTVEPRTALSVSISRGKSAAPDNDLAAGQFEVLTKSLKEAGYEHYEISNFALPGRYAKHNTNYWKGIPYLGLGPSAHSFNGSSRQWNVANNSRYLDSILKGGSVPFEKEILSETDHFNEYLMTSLRTMWGADIQYMERRFGAAATRELLGRCHPYVKKGWLTAGHERIALTNEGKLFADGIAASLFR